MVFIVIPAFNEEESIGRVMGGLFEHGYKNIIVVDDGSTDNTREVAGSMGAHVVSHEINRGQGASLQTGNECALSMGARLVVHFDADGQFNPADIKSAIKILEEKNLDVVLGSRFLDGRSNIPWTKRHILFPLGRLINRIITGVKLSDAHNGFRVLTRRALEKLHINHDRMAHNSEIIKLLKQQNLAHIEHPVEVMYHEYGQGFSGGIKILLELLRGKFLN
ncbi:MAG: glycosyltransferase family 2 protein [Patescibacteria group bacterium]